MGDRDLAMVGLRTLCVLQLAVVACMALPFDGATEFVQVLESGDSLPANMDEMKSMINSAMKHTEERDLGEMNNAKAQQADLTKTMDEISENEAISEEMELMAKADCQMTQWTAWSKCNAECGGGSTKRSRHVTVEAANGGKACPANDDGTPFVDEEASCNTESCAKEEAQHQAMLRHKTAEEQAKEDEENAKILKRAMSARSVDDMSREMHHWISKNTMTRMVHVVPIGESPPTDEEQIQDALKKAIAKNTVDQAMAGFEKVEEKAAPTPAKE